jgi:hypothetical protein
VNVECRVEGQRVNHGEMLPLARFSY